MTSTALTTLTSKLAATLDMGDGVGLVETLKATAFKGQVSDAQMTALMVVANQYGLNPWTKEIYAFPDKNNGIVPVVGVDGWSRIINNHPQFDGIEFEQDDSSCTCIIFRKDRNHPTKVTEWMAECKRNGVGPWQSHPWRMLRHKALIQCARLAFGYGGIYDTDEAERIVEATAPRNMGPVEEVKPEVATAFDPERFKKNLPIWRNAIAAGKATADSVIAKANTLGQLTQEQIDAIRAPIASPVTDVQPKQTEGMPAVTFARVNDALLHAQNEDALNVAADLIGEVSDPEFRIELNAVYEKRMAELAA